MALRFKPTFVPAFTSNATLKAIETRGTKLNRIILGTLGGALVSAQLVAGSDADAPANGVWRPDDYDADSNQVVFKLTSGAPA